MAYCCAELAVSFPGSGATIASTHCVSSQRDGQADLAKVAGYTATVCPTAVTIPPLTGLNEEQLR